MIDRGEKMNKRTLSVFVILSVILVASLLLASCGTSSKSTPTPIPSGSNLDGQALMQQRCSVCHSVNRVTSAHKTADQWKTTVDRMISHGAILSPQEEQTLVDYLAQNYK
jgi:mono/diheme cytochrome c family protein